MDNDIQKVSLSLSELPLSLRFILKSAAFLAHHKHLNPSEEVPFSYTNTNDSFRRVPFDHRIGAIYIAGEGYSNIFHTLEGKPIFIAIYFYPERIIKRGRGWIDKARQSVLKYSCQSSHIEWVTLLIC